MCPGGFIVPAASGPEQVVVNGMSPSNRGSRWSNSGMVVEIQPEDFINEELRMESGELAAQQNEQLLALNPSLSNSQLSMFNTQLLPCTFRKNWNVNVGCKAADVRQLRHSVCWISPARS